MDDEHEWFPISSVPNDRPVEIATFPMTIGSHVPNLTIGNIPLAYPKATHWREATEETRRAIYGTANAGETLVLMEMAKRVIVP